LNETLVTVQRLTKNYQALRPLRIESLARDRAPPVGVMGVDVQAAEIGG
jgi:hypothetical protein